MKYLGEFMSYILLAVFAQNILFDRAIGLSEIITAVSRKKLLPRLLLLVSVYSSAGVMLTWLLSRFVSGQAEYILFAMMYLLLCAVMYFASDRLLLRISPETHDVWGAPARPREFRCGWRAPRSAVGRNPELVFGAGAGDRLGIWTWLGRAHNKIRHGYSQSPRYAR